MFRHLGFGDSRNLGFGDVWFRVLGVISLGVLSLGFGC